MQYNAPQNITQRAYSGNVTPDTLSLDLLRRMHAYWRAANYLSVGQIYLQDNPLLETPLKLSRNPVSNGPAVWVLVLASQEGNRSLRGHYRLLMIMKGERDIAQTAILGVGLDLES
jgi:hypothetical protein